MSDLDSWENDPSAGAGQTDENLSRQTQKNLNLNQNRPQNLSGNASTFRPSYNAPSFQPGAQSFMPQNQYPQYGYDQNNPSYYGQGQQEGYYPQYAQGAYGGQPQSYGYPQYGAQGSYANTSGQNFGGYNQQHPQQGFQPGQTRAPVIAKRPQADATGDQNSPSAATAASADGKPAAPKSSAPKVLKIGGSPAPMAKNPDVKAEGGAKVLSLGAVSSPTPAASAVPAEAGNKAAAVKAIEKTGEGTVSTPASSGKTSPAPASGTNSPSVGESKAAAAAAKREADAVAKEQEETVDEATLGEMYGKEHVNLLFMGHVDAGKSSLGGSILFATGMVDERTMEKYKREAKEQGRESWYLSWALDLTKEERAKGKTVEVGRGFFETEKRRYTILDAPGHKNFVPNMIGGASQADVGVLVISARKGEYETGFEKGGQTREHAVLAKTQGVNKLIVVVNKMDDPTVEWKKERYDECITKLTTFLKGTGYNPKTDLMFMPISALTGYGIKEKVPESLAPWWTGPTLLDYLDGMKSLERKINAPFMMPVNGKYRDMGTILEGKIESGIVRKNDSILMMPNKQSIEIVALYGETEDEIQVATCGEQVRLRVRGVEEEEVSTGFVLCSPRRPVHCVAAFEAQIRILELKSILTAGFTCVMHVHAAIEEVQFSALLHKLEKGTNRKSKTPPAFAGRGMSIIARLESVSGSSFCIERFEDYPQLGRFTLRSEGQTIAIGKITKLITDA